MLNLVNQYSDSGFIYGNRQKISLTSVNDRTTVNFLFTKPQYTYWHVFVGDTSGHSSQFYNR